MKSISLTVLAICSLGISVLSCFAVLRYGKKLLLVDTPNERSSHTISVPRGGGIGICIVTVLACSVVLHNTLLAMVSGTLGMLSLIDDRFNLSSLPRLFIQVILTAIVVIQHAGLPDSMTSWMLMLFWIVFIIGTGNIYNFMDGIDGMAGMTGIICMGFISYFAYAVALDRSVMMAGIALVSACVGFLAFNFPKAVIFMGDTGSVLLGFIFAFFIMKFTHDISSFLCLTLFLAPFYADAIVTLFYRLYRKENILKSHRSHLYQYLSNEMRYPHWKVTMMYVGVQCIMGTLSLYLHQHQNEIAFQVLLYLIFIVVFLVIYYKIKRSSASSLQI